MISAKILRSQPIKMSVTTPKSRSHAHPGSCPPKGEALAHLPGKSRILPWMRLFSIAHFLGCAAIPLPIMAQPTAIATLTQELNQRDSATAVLQQRCPIPITARLLGADAPASLHNEARHALNAPSDGHLTTRHVLLLCEGTALSEAWNLYLPDRLTPQARTLLADGHTPFGRAVGEGHFYRQRLSRPMGSLPPLIIIENRAILRRKADGKPLAYLIERYNRAALTPVTTPGATNLNVVPHQGRASAP